ncbi:MAG: hypothetical protein HQK54_15875, partial [Oligoflexales bacterium]|nr:hypothetical protein [Oligoflexales bacterium]
DKAISAAKEKLTLNDVEALKKSREELESKARKLEDEIKRKADDFQDGKGNRGQDSNGAGKTRRSDPDVVDAEFENGPSN